MKFKYYLRGLGIGILISTIILSVSFAMNKNDLSDDEIIARAKELGMVMEDTGKDTIPKATETEDEIPKSTEGGFNTEQTDIQPGTTDSGEISQDVGTDGADAVPPSQDGTNMVQKEFTVEVGDSSNAVSQRLQEEGLVKGLAMKKLPEYLRIKRFIIKKRLHSMAEYDIIHALR